MTTSSFRPSPEFETLLNLLCEEQLTPEQARQFEEMVACDEEACWYYLCYVHVHGMLTWNAGHGVKPRGVIQKRKTPSPATAPILPPFEAPSPLVSLLNNVWCAYVIAAVSLTFALTVAWFALTSRTADDPSIASAFTNQIESVGQITGLADCQWEDSATTASHGDAIPLGRRYSLRSGLLEITYDDGAKVILQGPATYEVDSGSSGFLSLGKLTGRISTARAQGFTVRTPTATVVDLGTEFAVDVKRTGQTTSHVFQGQVKLLAFLSDSDSQAREMVLQENETCQVARRADDAGLVPVFHRVTLEPGTCASVRELSEKINNRQAKAFQAWQAFRDSLSRDPSLLAYYDFQRDPSQPNLLRNVVGNDPSLDGEIQGAQWGNGRMPGKQALRFAGKSDFVKINLPQKTSDLTLAAWVYVDSHLELPYGLLMSDRWLQPGQVHWELAANGSLRCEIVGIIRQRLTASENPLATSSAVFDRGRLCRWTHLATVYHRAAQQIQFYRDGILLETIDTAAEKQSPIVIGPARIGGWLNRYGGGEKDRPFYGCMDELMVFGRPLEHADIQQLYWAGGSQSVNP